jgi:hypothetical protein
MPFKIYVNQFQGRFPKLSAKLLGPYNAQTALNTDLRGGKLKPFADLNTSVGTLGATDKTIYKLGSEWMDWSVDANIVRSMVTTSDKVFVSGEAYPRQYTNALYPSDHRRLGIVPPPNTANIGFTVIPGETNTEIRHTVSYVYTYVSSWGEESAPSPATAATDVEARHYVNLSNLSVASGADKNDITAKRIYRLNVGTFGAEYQFLEEISAAATTHDDYDAAAKDLDEVSSDILPTEGWIQPPDTLAGLLQYANGMLAGFVNNELYFCEPFYPYAWPLKYVMSFDSDIVGIAAFNESIIVITTTKPYIVSGVDPEGMTQNPVPVIQGCVAKRGIVETPKGVIYPSLDGLVRVSSSGVSVITQSLITKEQWSALTPANLISFWHDGQYYGFFNGTDLGFTITEDGWIDIDLNGANVYGGWVSPADDKLYLIVDVGGTRYIRAFNDHASNKLTYTFKSKIFDLPFARSLTCAKMKATFGSITFTLYGDGAQKQQQAITSSHMFRLAPGRWETMEFMVSGTAEMDSIVFSSDTKGLIVDE